MLAQAMMNGADSLWVQLGALGIVGAVVGYLTKWLTSSLNGKLDRLSDAIRSNEVSHQTVMRENTDTLRSLTNTIERLNRVP